MFFITHIVSHRVEKSLHVLQNIAYITLHHRMRQINSTSKLKCYEIVDPSVAHYIQRWISSSFVI